jgi:nucleoside-diphosphate-sugar epimerase
MHLSANEGIEGLRFAVTGGQGFVGAALSLELLRRGAREVRSLDLRASSSWSQQLLDAGVRIIQGQSLQFTIFSSDRCNPHGFTLLSLWPVGK